MELWPPVGFRCDQGLLLIGNAGWQMEKKAMEQHVGLDVSLELTSVCVVDSGGKALWEGKCLSTPEAIARTIHAKAPLAARVGPESGPLSAWHWHELKKLKLPVVCLDARHAKVALAPRLNKSDRWRLCWSDTKALPIRRG
jgi:hypothetical protein